MNPPSIKQMMNRANSGHLRALRACRDNTTAVNDAEPISAVRGMMTVFSTLRRWGCVEGDQLTGRGRELLAHMEGRANEIERRRMENLRAQVVGKPAEITWS